MLASKQCKYTVSYGLVAMLTALTGKEKREIWSMLVDETQVCFDRMDKKGIRDSWRWVEFPGTEVRLKIKVNRADRIYEDGQWIDRRAYSCNIKFDPNSTEQFTSRQVEEFLVENILLDVE